MIEREQIRRILYESLAAAAPGSTPMELDPSADLREELDLDSMDFLAFVTALHKALSVDIQERDYRQLATLQSAEQFLAARLAAAPK